MPTYPTHIDPSRKPPNTRYDDRGKGRWVYRDRRGGREYNIGDSTTRMADLWTAVDNITAGVANTFKALRAKHATDLEEQGGDATENLDHSSWSLTV